MIPGKVYNTIIETLNTGFQNANNLKHGEPPLFLAAILRSTTPLDFQTLRHSGFRFLDYEASPVPPYTEMTQQGGAVAAALIDIATFALEAVKDVANIVTTALGALDALFAGRVDYRMTFTMANLNAGFASPTMTRAWGPSAGLPLGASGLQVTFLENLLGIFPLTFSADTDDSGLAALRPAANQSNVLLDLGYCMQLQNDAAWATSFLLPNEVCNLQIFVDTALVTGFGGGTVNVGGDLPDPSQDREVPVTLSVPQLGAVYGMTDAQRYMQAVAGGYKAKTAHVIVGDSANIIAWFKDPFQNSATAFTMGLHLRNESDADLTKFLTPYVNNLGYAASLDAISLGASEATGQLFPSWIEAVFANNDIIMPDQAAQGFGAREIGTHEFGHFILMNLLQDHSSVAIDNLIGDTIFSGKGSDYNYSTRYSNEAFADFISGQVTGIANYQWLATNQIKAPGDPAAEHVCDVAPCYDWNFWQDPGSSSTDVSGIALLASLMHDAFDGQEPDGQASSRYFSQPTNADPWTPEPTTAAPYTFTVTPWGDCDGPDLVNGLAPACRRGTGPQAPSLAPPVAPCGGTAGGACVASESAALPGTSILDLGHALQSVADANQSAHGPPYFTDQVVFTAVDQTMAIAGLSWCERCQVLALHVSENFQDALSPMGLLQLCYRGSPINPTGDANLMSWQLPSVGQGSAPDANLRVDAATCQLCPPDKFPDPNGQCTIDCPADFVVDGATAPLETLSEPTTATGLNIPDTCPGEFVVEVDNPNQLFARGASSFGGSLVVSSPSPQSCDQTFTLSFADLPGTTGFVPEQTVTDTGSFQSSQVFLSPCGTLPAITLSSPAQLTHGSSPIRFVTPVVSGVEFVLNISVPAQTQ